MIAICLELLNTKFNTDKFKMPTINIEVVFALAHKQTLISFSVETGTTALDAVILSGLIEQYPEQINPDNLSLGIYSKKIEPTTLLRENDRVEIYRPLVADPKEIRRKKAQKKEQKTCRKSN